MRAKRPLHLIYVILSELYKRKYLNETPYVTVSFTFVCIWHVGLYSSVFCT
jgi:hypothetical protein